MKLKQKLSRGIAYLITTSLLCGIGWAKEKQNKGTLEMAEKYVPKVIIEAKWEKVKEELVPHEWDPWGEESPYGGPWIGSYKSIVGRFGKGTISFGFEPGFFGTPEIMPCCITIDQDENLYILDPHNVQILKFDKNGNYLDTIKLERDKLSRRELGQFEIAEGHQLKEVKKIFVDSNGNVYIKASKFPTKELKFSKTGKFISKGAPSHEENIHSFISKIQDSNKGIVQVIDQKKNIKVKIIVNLNSKLVNKKYNLQNIEVIGEDKWGNLYIKMIAEKEIAIERKVSKKMEQIYGLKYIEQVYKYNPQGKLLFIFEEKENPDYIVRNEIIQTTVVTDNGTVYDLVIVWEEEQKIEKDYSVYKLDPSDKMLRNVKDIEEFLNQRKEVLKDLKETDMEEYSKKKNKKITLEIREGISRVPQKLKIIKWEKKE